MNQWDILLDRINQNKFKADYVDELNKENEKKYWEDKMWTKSLSKQADSLCDRLFECFEDMDPYEAMDCRDIDIDIQKRAVYKALVSADIDDIISDLEDYKSACSDDDLEQYDKIQKLLDDVLQFEKDVDSHYVQQFDPHYTVSVRTEHDMLDKGTVKEQQAGKQNVYSNVNPKNIVKAHSKQEKDDKEK